MSHGRADALARAMALHRAGDLSRAEGIYKKILAAEPANVGALHLLGVIAHQRGRNDRALQLITRALSFRPDHFDALYNLGEVLRALGRPDEAIASYDKALALKPSWPEAFNNRGNALKDQGSLEQAAASYRKAIDLRPDHADAHTNLGIVQKNLGFVDDSLSHHDKAIALYSKDDPSMPTARLNRALALFVAGRIAPAWIDFESRWTVPGAPGRRPFSQPWWTGQPLKDKTLLVWGEQGVGDEIVAAGMLADVARAGARCIYECDTRLAALFQRSFDFVQVLPRRAPPAPDCLTADYQIPAMSLGRHFRNDVADFPRHAGYLVPDPARLAHWRAWLDRLGPGRKVGLSWRGRFVQQTRWWDFAPVDLLPIVLGVPGLVFVNLQYDSTPDDLAMFRERTGVELHGPEGIDLTNDLDDVAALMGALDAVVGPATSVAILAGAVGRPTWMWAHYPMHNEKEICDMDHVPWCPSIRVERRGFGEDWAGALGRVAESLRALADSNRTEG